MSEQPSNPNTLQRRDPTAPLTPAHKDLIKMLAEIAVKDYLAELVEEDSK